MRRLPLLALLALAALGAGCVHEAPGACADDAGCRAGEHCAGGVCLRDGQVALGGACELQAECASWATCAAGRCALRPGACEAEPHCAAWQDCGAAHACVLAPGMCDGEGDCAAWRSCLAHGCVLDAGRCERHADCAGWQYCDGGHTCQDVGATCAGDGDCQAWQTCSTGHCANRPGACGADEQCDPAWQVCGAEHACVAAPGFCASSLDCAAWQTCAPDHVCTDGYTCATDADCLAGEPCVLASTVAGAVGQCSVPVSRDGRGVTIWGTLAPGACSRDVFAPLHAPTRVSLGLTCIDSPLWNKASVAPDGAIVYLHAGGEANTLARFVPDGWERDADRWTFPSSPYENDVSVPTPACASVGGAVMQAGTGALLYVCTNGGWNWYDTSGNLVLRDYSIHAWNAAGLKLVSGSGGLWLLDANHARIGAEIGASVPFSWTVYHARTHGDGFRMLLHSIGASDYELWYVTPDGTATREGAYPAPPPGIDFYWEGRMVIDANGALHGLGSGAGTDDVIVRCELEPGTCEVVYDEADAPDIRYDVFPPRVFAFLHASYLITGP